MEKSKENKIIKIVKKGEDDSNENYWFQLSGIERLKELEELRQQYIIWKYGAEQRFQRIYRIIKRA